MQTMQVGQFKSKLSTILEKIQKDGEKVVIEFGKNHKKVAMLVPYQEEKRQRVFGVYEGEAVIPDDFDEEDEEINAMFYGQK